MNNEEEDRKIIRKRNIENKLFDRFVSDENYKKNKKQKHEIKSKKEELEQEDWEYWRDYYK